MHGEAVEEEGEVRKEGRKEVGWERRDKESMGCEVDRVHHGTGRYRKGRERM